MNSHVNLSPIKLLVKGSVSRNDKAQAHQSHAGRASVTSSTQAYRWYITLTSRGSYWGQGNLENTSLLRRSEIVQSIMSHETKAA